MIPGGHPATAIRPRRLTLRPRPPHSARMISPGRKLDLSLPLQVVRDGAEHATTLGGLLRRRTILSVYMKNNTPGCDRQNDSLAAHAAAFRKAGCDLVAVSRDSCGSHLRYAARKKLPYALVSDPGDALARATDSLVEKSMYGRKYTGPARAAFILEPDGTVLAVIEKVDTRDHAAQLQAVLKGL